MTLPMSDEEEAPENENEDVLDQDGEDGEEGEGGEEEEGSNKKLFIIIGAALLLILGGGAGAYFMGFLDPLLGVEKVEEHAEGHEEDGEHGEDHGGEYEDSEEEHAEDGGDDGHGDDGKGGGKFVEIPTMIVNLNTDDGTPRYLRLSVQLELKSSKDHAKVSEAIPKVIDQFQTYLRELRVRDLRGSAGIYRLQMELLWRVNQAAAPAKIKDVLFQEILIQ